MPNMSHCMFENTYNDLIQCKEALDDMTSLEEFIEARGQYDKHYVMKLLKLCKELSYLLEDEE